MDALVSVIIPSYKHEAFIGEAIESVLRQTYKNWELIVIDDASPDNTYDYAQAILSNEIRATLVKKSENKGLIDSLNHGIKMAQGDYVALLASDDSWAPEYLAATVEITKKYVNAIVFVDASHGNSYFNEERIIPYNEMRNILLRRNPIPAIGCLYPAAFLRKICPMPDDMYTEDYYMRWQSVFLGYDHYHMARQLVHYRRPDGSMSQRPLKMAIGQYRWYSNIKLHLKTKERIVLLYHLARRTIVKATVNHCRSFLK